MRASHKAKGLMKKAVAVMVGITMAFGALALPNSFYKNSFNTAYSDSISIGDVTFIYTFSERTEEPSIKLTNAYISTDTVELPSSITVDGIEYPVTEIGGGFLSKNTTIKKLTVPDSVTYICENFLFESSLEEIVLSNKLEHVGSLFCGNCYQLSSVKCTSTNLKISEIGSCVFFNCRKLYNDKYAICLGNWLIDYNPPYGIDQSVIKLCDLGNDGTKIDSIANFAVHGDTATVTVDLQGIKRIDSSNFNSCSNLKYVINDDEVIEVGNGSFDGSLWLEEAKQSKMAKLGSVLLYYKTDDGVIDLTSEQFKGITSVKDNALEDCHNIKTIICKSDCIFGRECFPRSFDQETVNAFNYDPMPLTPTYNIKDVFLDGERLTLSRLEKDKKSRDWLRQNSWTLCGAEFISKMAEEKIKILFKQLDIPYYGMNNDMKGTYTPTEEFYIRLKIHNYLSQYDYDHEYEYSNSIDAFLTGGKVTCSGYAYLAHYFMECAGIEAETINAPIHYYNTTKIGNEWFESDDGWNAQNNNHSYSWFAQSSSRMAERDPKSHASQDAHLSYHAIGNRDAVYQKKIAERTLGDINGDNKREYDDAELLWAYIKGKSTEIDEKAADINFDGTVDVTDAVLLDQFVNSKVLPHEEFVFDGYAQKVKLAFLNGTDYGNIKYLFTDREGYITLPDDLFEAPEGKKISYDVGMAGQKVRITDPLTVVKVKWIDENEPDYSEPDSSKDSSSKPDSSKPDSSKPDSSKPDSSKSDSSNADEDRFKLGDVNADRTIDIEDAVAIIQHINGLTPLKDDEEKRADVSKDGNIDIDDAVLLISYINGNSTF